MDQVPQLGAVLPFLLFGGEFPDYNRLQKKSWYQLVLASLLEDVVDDWSEARTTTRACHESGAEVLCMLSIDWRTRLDATCCLGAAWCLAWLHSKHQRLQRFSGYESTDRGAWPLYLSLALRFITSPTEDALEKLQN